MSGEHDGQATQRYGAGAGALRRTIILLHVLQEAVVALAWCIGRSFVRCRAIRDIALGRSQEKHAEQAEKHFGDHTERAAKIMHTGLVPAGRAVAIPVPGRSLVANMHAYQPAFVIAAANLLLFAH